MEVNGNMPQHYFQCLGNFCGMHEKILGKASIITRLQFTMNPSDVPWDVFFFQSAEWNKARLTTFSFFLQHYPPWTSLNSHMNFSESLNCQKKSTDWLTIFRSPIQHWFNYDLLFATKLNQSLLKYRSYTKPHLYMENVNAYIYKEIYSYIRKSIRSKHGTVLVKTIKFLYFEKAG